MTYVSDPIRRTVIERAREGCEYCLIHQTDSLYSHEVDHIIPEKHRGETTLNNLCLSCLECNRHKGSDFASFDPETRDITLLFNPRTDHWHEHFTLDGARIMPLTAVGRVTVFVLKMNDLEQVNLRAMLMKAGRYPRIY